MSGFTLGQAIYIAIKPLFKIYLCMGLGYLMAKRNILTVEGSRVVSQIVLNYLIPCLIFSNILNNIKDTDIKIIGVILLTSYLYFACGAAWAGFIRLTTPIPKAWFGGLMVACIINNSGDLPIAYVQTLGASSSFASNSTSLGTAYCVIYSIGFLSFLFNFGGQRLILWDAKRTEPDKFDPTVPPLSIEKVVSLFRPSRATKTEAPNSPDSYRDIEMGEYDEQKKHHHDQCSAYNNENVMSLRMVPSSSSMSIHEVPADDIGFNATADVASLTRKSTHEDVVSNYPNIIVRKWEDFKNMNFVTSWIANFFTDFRRPQAVAIVVSLVFTMIPWVRRLFVDDPNQHVKGIPNAPDGKPILDFFMDFTVFIGEAQVQFGLMLLGATIARLQVGQLVRGFWKTILSMGIFKLVVLPVIAILWVSKLQEMKWIDPNDPMAAVVLIASAATPSATVQIYITTLLADPNEPMVQLNCFAVCLIVMYTVLPITMTILMTYTLMNVIHV